MGRSERQRASIVEDYLRMLELTRSSPDLAFLTEIMARHLASFAFSSVGARLGEDLGLDLESLHRRIVVRRRGGYCFEQNGLLFEILQELGFDVRLYLARVIYNQDIHPGLTHRVTLVELQGRTWLVDVGFGPMGPRNPVSMCSAESRQGHRTFRTFEPRAGEFHLQTWRDEGYYSLYRFELSRYGQADCEVGHFFSHKHPKATFVNHLVVSRILEREVRSLRNREYRVISEAGETRLEIDGADHLRGLLDRELGIRITEAESHALFESAP